MRNKEEILNDKWKLNPNIDLEYLLFEILIDIRDELHRSLPP